MMDWREVAVDGGAHLTRRVDMYKELGFEVRLEEVKPEEVEQCTQYLQEKGEKVYRIFARRKPGSESE